jgi:uncharacterized protein YjbI with pentapeptide repeats
MTDSINKWYVKKEGHISGPFSKQVISNNLKLGRLSSTDEISHDKINWSLLHLSEHLLSTHKLPVNTLSLDERNGFDRRQSESAEQTASFSSRRQQERRAPESYTHILRRQLRTELFSKYRVNANASPWPIAVLITAILLITLLAITYPTKLPVPSANCDQSAAANVDWSNCQKLYLDLTGAKLTGAKLMNSQLFSAKLLNADLAQANLAYADLRLSDLSYSNLINATLLGANLQNVDLSYSDLRNADLSFANLAGANIGETQLEGAVLSNAIWIDGTHCSINSIGECLKDD